MIRQIGDLYLAGKITADQMHMLIELHHYLEWKRKPLWKRILVIAWRVLWD